MPHKIERIRNALTELWALKGSEPANLFSDARFIALQTACQEAFPDAGSGIALNFALSNAVRCLGLPCAIPRLRPELVTSPDLAANILVAALEQKEHRQVNLCPLDLADYALPDLEFGPCKVRRFTASELAVMFDAEVLARRFPKAILDLKRLSQFTWLCIDQIVPLNDAPGQQAMPFWYERINSDFGRIEPHSNKLSPSVEAALFFLMLAPWEEWGDMPNVDWRPFHLPWTHTSSSSIFSPKVFPPSPDTLSWEPRYFHDGEGGEIELEVPVQLPLNEGVRAAGALLSAATWQSVSDARASPLFETPVAHFLVRAYAADGIDEFLAHLTVIEAALGLESDFRKLPQDPHKNVGATRRMAARVSALLDSAADGVTFTALFSIRSAFLHGRSMRTISSEDRIRARALARRVVWALIQRALLPQPPSNRELFAEELLTKGLQMKP